MPEITWETPLARQLAAHPAPARAAGITASEWPQSAIHILRGKPEDSAYLTAVESALGIALPTAPRQSAAKDALTILRLSPDEWLLKSPWQEQTALATRLQRALANQHAQLVDNSGGYTGLELRGEAVETVLRHLTPYPVENLAAGEVIGTVMEIAHIILHKHSATHYSLIIRRSFADYVWKLLAKASRPYGLAVA